MPGQRELVVKCEPQSDEDNCDSQYNHFLHSRVTSSEARVKLEQNLHSDGVSHLLLPCVEELAPAPAGPAATPVREPPPTPAAPASPAAHVATFETLEPAPPHNAVQGSSLIDRHLSLMNTIELADSSDFAPLLAVKDEPVSEGEQQQLSGDEASDSSGPPAESTSRGSPKSWSQRDMDNALEALRKHHMSLTKASSMYGIPSTTLWQRAHRLGIDTPKKEGASKSWSEADLKGALHALRAGAISANKASKAYGIPSSTLYKIARREGIRLAAPFNAAPTAWRRADLARALAAIRAGAASVQRAAAQYGIPTGTLYGRCKREGIELSRSNPTPWSEDAMGEALEAVRVGQMSINQAAIHYNLPYSSLYGRFKRCKYQPQFQPQQQEPKMELEQMNPQDPYYLHRPLGHEEQYAEVPLQEYLVLQEYGEGYRPPPDLMQYPVPS